MYYAPRNILYMNNAKAGCSTVKGALLKCAARDSGQVAGENLSFSSIHQASDVWSKDYSTISATGTFSFSVVRNPFARILSAFLDKFGPPGACDVFGRTPILQNQFYWQHGIDPSHRLSFVEFLRHLKDSDTLFDQHWRPQVSNVFAGAMPLSEVHFLESFDKTQHSICARLDSAEPFVRYAPHNTDARDKVAQYISDEVRELILDIYREDFEVFGYSTDPADVSESPSGILNIPAHTPILTDMLADMTSQNEAPDMLRQNLHALGVAQLSDDLDTLDAKSWSQRVVQATAAPDVGIRYLALSVATSFKKTLFGSDFYLSSLHALTRMAPYQIGNHAKLVRELGARGDLNGAREMLDAMSLMTFQDGLVAKLSQSLKEM